MPMETYIKDMNLNYFGNLKLLKEIINQYKIKKDIIKDDKIDIACVGSCLGIIGSIGYTTYCPTKYALKGLLDSLRFELLGTKINLHYYGPSNMETPGLIEENKNKPKIVSDMESNAKSISADEGAHILLANLDKYMITSEPDLELLKDLRMKCFDIETDECYDRYMAGEDTSPSIGERGDMAVSIVDDLYFIIH